MLYDPEAESPELTLDALEALSPEERSLADRRAAWIERARPEQLAPIGVNWTYFLLLGGRGMGKTRSASEETSYRCATRPNIRWAYVAPTSNDLRRTCFEGQSGLLACTPKEMLRGGSVEKAYNRSLGELYFANGSKIEGYSAEQPNRIRGGNFHGATCLREGTLVTMGDGSAQAIETVSAGDLVMTRRGPRLVLAATMTNPDADVSEVLTHAGLSLVGTTNHPVYVSGRGFVPLGELRQGDRLCRLSAAPECIEDMVVRLDRCEQRARVYDLTVEGEHEFFANGILVHNCEELAAWNNGKPDECWDILDLAVREPPFPQYIIATTPKPIPLLRKLIKDEKTGKTIISRGSTYANRANLASSFLERLVKYEGTKYGRQEIYGEVLDEDEGAIFARSWFKLWPHDRELPVFHYIILSIDGAFSEKQTADNSACSAWGVFRLARRQKGTGVWLPSRPCMMLLDLWAEKLRFGLLQQRVEEAIEARYGGKSKRTADGTLIDEIPGRRPDIVLIENKASGQSLLQQLWDKNLPVEPWDPGKMDKAMRCHAASPWALNGHIWMMESKQKEREAKCVDWAEPLLDQACTFTGDPNSLPHDDELDTMTQAINWAYAENIFADGGPLGDEGATEAHGKFAKDKSLWPQAADGDRGYGVQSFRPVGLERNPYDG